jgi:hypothetical protein
MLIACVHNQLYANRRIFLSKNRGANPPSNGILNRRKKSQSYISETYKGKRAKLKANQRLGNYHKHRAKARRRGVTESQAIHEWTDESSS